MRLAQLFSLLFTIALSFSFSVNAEVVDLGQEGAVSEISYGVIHRIDAVEGQIVIDDRVYDLPEVLVFDDKRVSKPVFFQRVYEGMSIYYRPESMRGRAGFSIRRFWSSDPSL